MRVLIRCFNLSIILIVSILIFAQMMIFNVKRDELINCISTAMSSTQMIMQEQIEDGIYGTNVRRKTITSNEQYLDEFLIHFYKLVTTDSDYIINVYGIDYTKGLLDIEIESHFKMFNGKEKVIKSRKTSIIDVIE